jgi:uncharacterized caspase-like protein
VSNEFYLIPAEVGPGLRRGEKPDTNALSHCISSEELSLWLRRVDAGELVLVIDACHSAASVSQSWFKPGPMGSRGLGQLAYDKRMRILAASQADDYAIENRQLRHGLLTYALVKEGLDGAKADFRPADGRITLGEWLAFGEARVPELHRSIRERLALGGSPDGARDAAGLRFVLIQRNENAEQTKAIPATEELLEKSSLSLRNAFQRPALFDYSRGRIEPVLQRRN